MFGFVTRYRSEFPMRSRTLFMFLAACLPVACSEKAPTFTDAELAVFRSEPKAPGDNPVTPEKVALGRKLYHDSSLSKGGDISCASCHDLNKFGQDGRKTSLGTGGAVGPRNAPTTLNAFLHFKQFWDGRADTVEDQAIGPVLNPKEHGIRDEAELVAKLKQDPETVAAFARAFPGEDDPVTAANFQKAVGAFERTLRTRSRFDEFLDGRSDALTPAEKRGLRTFLDTGCTTCHNGRLLGGRMFQKLGLVTPYEGKDLGRYEVTKNDADRHVFKVPSLLNVAETAPYFHDGSIPTLEEAVRTMARLQLGKNLTNEQVSSIVTFLKALTGKVVGGVEGN